jgi:hypothetical protein
MQLEASFNIPITNYTVMPTKNVICSLFIGLSDDDVSTVSVMQRQTTE